MTFVNKIMYFIFFVFITPFVLYVTFKTLHMIIFSTFFAVLFFFDDYEVVLCCCYVIFLFRCGFGREPIHAGKQAI